MDNESLLTLLMRPDVRVPGRENQQHYRLTFTITKTNHQLTDQLYLFCHESHRQKSNCFVFDSCGESPEVKFVAEFDIYHL